MPPTVWFNKDVFTGVSRPCGIGSSATAAGTVSSLYTAAKGVGSAFTSNVGSVNTSSNSSFISSEPDSRSK